VPVDSVSTAPDMGGFVGFPSARTPSHLAVDATVSANYSLHTLSASSLGRGDGMAIRQRADAGLALQLGLGARLAVALRLPALLYQTADSSPERPALRQQAVGNPALDARVHVWGEPIHKDGTVPDGGGLALRGIVQAPVGGRTSYFHDSATRAELQLISDVKLFGISAGAAFGYQRRFADDVPAFVRLRDRLRLMAGLRMPLPLLTRLFSGHVQDFVMFELEAATEATDAFAKRTTPVEGRLSYRVSAGNLAGALIAGAGLLDAIGSPDLRVSFMLGYAPRARDQDGDGVLDAADGCVHSPEDRDGFQDNDGCADDDNDGDMVLDEDDRCPLESAVVGQDEDEDGCTDR
jgi:hypothetical protein